MPPTVTETQKDGVRIVNVSGKYEDVAAYVDSLINKPKGHADLTQQPLSTGWACISLKNFSHGGEAVLTFDPDYEVKNRGDRHQTITTVRGHRVSVGLKVKSIQDEYPMQGYGTHQRQEKVVKGQIIEVEVHRSNSCD